MGNETILFLNRIFAEAMALLMESHDFLMRVEDGGEETLPVENRLAFHAASMRLAARMSEIMAWMLAQKAADSGEMTEAQAASPAFSLSHLPVCKGREGEEDESLPEDFRSMLRRSRALYERIERLEGRLHDDPSPPPGLPEDAD